MAGGGPGGEGEDDERSSSAASSDLSSPLEADDLSVAGSGSVTHGDEKLEEEESIASGGGGGSVAQPRPKPRTFQDAAAWALEERMKRQEAEEAAARAAAEAAAAQPPSRRSKSIEMVQKTLAKWNPASWMLGGIGPAPDRAGEGGEKSGKSDGEEDTEEEEEEEDEGDDAASGLVKVDPQATKPLLTSHVNIGLACLNVLLGLLYVTWRIMRGLSTKESWMAWTLLGHDYVDPEDPERTWDWKAEMERHWFAWTILLSEVLLMIGVWLTHFTRVFPTKRTRCTMNDLIDADYELSKSTQVCIVLPTRGEDLSVLREVLLSIMSLHLWPGKLDVRRNLRLIVVDDQRRSEVKLLLGLCYRFAAIFCNNRKVRQQLKTEGKGDMTLVGFYEFYLQCTAGFARAYSENFDDAFEIANMIQKICRENCVPQDWDGLDLPSGRRVEPTASFIGEIMRLPRSREDFDEIRNILYCVYFARNNAGEPAINPFAGCVNAVLFPDDPADVDLLGDSRFLVLNEPTFSLQTEFLQRTIPYFFELHHGKKKSGYRVCKQVAFVHTALRYKDLKAKDPLAIRNHLLYDIKHVGRDGIGASLAGRHGTVYRVDVLQQGKDAKGKALVPEDKIRDYIGFGVGLSELTREESVPTSIQLFQRGYRSIYVNEAKETLNMCVEPLQDLDGRLQQIFEYYMSVVEVVITSPLALMQAQYTTMWHRIIVFEELWHGLILGLGTYLLLLCIPVYCITWTAPFYTHGMEFLLYFLTYYVTAALPTAVGLNWKLTRPDEAFRPIQLGVTTCYVPLVAYAGGALAEASRVLCSRSGRRQFTVDGAPTWPLFCMVLLLLCSGLITFIKWAQHKFQHPGIWLTSSVMVACAIGMHYPSAARGIRFKGLANFYSRYFTLGVLIIVVALWQGASTKGNKLPSPPKIGKGKFL